MRFLVVAAMVTMGLAQPVSDDFGQDLERFNKPYALFYRRAHGCSDHALTIDECVAGAGRIDRKLLMQSKEAAKRLFGLREAK